MNQTAQTEPLIIYLACPYSHESESIRKFRFTQANYAAGHLAGKGYGVMSPISQGHPIAETGLAAGDWETWAAVDKRMIDAADAVVVLDIPGLSKSEGVRAEVAYAIEKGKTLAVMAPLVPDVYAYKHDDEAVLFLLHKLGLPVAQSELPGVVNG